MKCNGKKRLLRHFSKNVFFGPLYGIVLDLSADVVQRNTSRTANGVPVNRKSQLYEFLVFSREYHQQTTKFSISLFVKMLSNK